MRLDDFNALPDPVGELAACCASPAWVRAVTGGRPYASVDDLVARADAALARLDEAELELAMAGHPRIGERCAHASSQREQAAVALADREVLDALAAGNRSYEERFGHVYLVCADGRSATDLLAVLHTRLHHSPTEERRTTRTELRKITDIRLRRLLT